MNEERNDKQDGLQPDAEARRAWEQLPQGRPSSSALPPAGDGLGWFFGLFTKLAAPLRGRKWLAWVFVALVVLGLVALAVWQAQ